jgi:CHAT domain-containing protein
LPFAALLSAPPVDGPMTAQTLRDAPWLGMRRNLAIVPSVSALKMLRTQGQGNAEGWEKLAYLGIGDPVFDGAPAPFRGIDADAMRTAETRRDAVRGLPRLPGTAREIAALEQVFPRDRVLTLTGTAASESRLDKLNGDGTLGSAGIVHFATHGLLAGSLSGLVEPALALTPPVGGVAVIGPWQTDDGLLLASEISQLRMNADWVVLSACNTAAGDRAGAEGLSGLARAFFYAGAKALLVTHWAVEDDVAARLMEDTVKNVGGAISRAEALRAAMAKVIADTSRDQTALPMSHPSVWAPFQLVGAPD